MHVKSLGLSLTLISGLATACFNPDPVETSETEATGNVGSTTNVGGETTSAGSNVTDASNGSGGGDSMGSSGAVATGPATTSMGDGTSSGGGAETSTGMVPDLPPEVTIVVPAMDLVMGDALFYDGYDRAMMLWYRDVTLEGVATDPEDGDISDSIEWTTDLVRIQPALLDAGASVTVRLYSNDCFGVLHTITASVVDSAGNAASSAPRQIFIYTVC